MKYLSNDLPVESIELPVGPGLVKDGQSLMAVSILLSEVTTNTSVLIGGSCPTVSSLSSVFSAFS
eukprot:11636192-Ditylum_brightwellii.AAC.1